MSFISFFIFAFINLYDNYSLKNVFLSYFKTELQRVLDTGICKIGNLKTFGLLKSSSFFIDSRFYNKSSFNSYFYYDKICWVYVGIFNGKFL